MPGQQIDPKIMLNDDGNGFSKMVLTFHIILIPQISWWLLASPLLLLGVRRLEIKTCTPSEGWPEQSVGFQTLMTKSNPEVSQSSQTISNILLAILDKLYTTSTIAKTYRNCVPASKWSFRRVDSGGRKFSARITWPGCLKFENSRGSFTYWEKQITLFLLHLFPIKAICMGGISIVCSLSMLAIYSCLVILVENALLLAQEVTKMICSL